jgi:Fe-S oxidoreductase
MFKEPEKGEKDINIERTGEALELRPEVIAVACPFCMTMITDGTKHFEKEDQVKVMDIAELVADNLSK